MNAFEQLKSEIEAGKRFRFLTEEEFKKNNDWHDTCKVPSGWGHDKVVNSVLGQELNLEDLEKAKYDSSYIRNFKFKFSFHRTQITELKISSQNYEAY